MYRKDSVDKKVVVITGGARGIGLGIARCFIQEGAVVVIVDANQEAASLAADDLSEKLGSFASGFGCDVTNRLEVFSVIEEIEAKYDGVDILINNAGICPFVEVMAMDEVTWKKTLDVNLTGSFHCTQAVAKGMISRNRGGRIIFITSLAENVTSAYQVDYGASKAGMRMTMVGFATALGQYGITSNAIAPGMIMTDMTRWSFEKPEVSEAMRARIPIGRVGTPEDIGNAAVFLASEKAAYISGITLRVDGGHQAVCS